MGTKASSKAVVENTTKQNQSTGAIIKTEKPEEKKQIAPPVPDPAKSFEEQRKDFERWRAYLKEKEEKLQRLEEVEKSIDFLIGCQEENNQCVEHPSMFTDQEECFLLELSGTGDNYRRKGMFKLNNPGLISDVLELLIQKLEAQAEKLQVLISKA